MVVYNKSKELKVQIYNRMVFRELIKGTNIVCSPTFRFGGLEKDKVTTTQKRKVAKQSWHNSRGYKVRQ